MIREALDAMMESRRRVFPCRSNRASWMGHPCERKCVYERTAWEQKKVPEMEVQYIFDYGNTIEDMTLRRLRDAGVKVSSQQRDFEHKETGITGHVDGMLDDAGGAPLEIKGINQFDFEGINSTADMVQSSKPWIRGYPAQLQLYMLLAGKPRGCFLIVNKGTSIPKEIWMDLDLGYCEDLLKKAERINAHVAAGTVPDRCAYNPELCDRCDFAHICLPPVENREEFLMAQAPEMEAKIARRAELDAGATEYDKLDKEIKTWAKALTKDFIVCGNWIIKKSVSKSGAVTVKIEALTK